MEQQLNGGKITEHRTVFLNCVYVFVCLRIRSDWQGCLDHMLKPVERFTAFGPAPPILSVVYGGDGTLHFLCISTALVFRVFAANVFHISYISHVGQRLI
jgi:hypothetical protein